MDISVTLTQTLSEDAATRNGATQHLAALADQAFPQYVALLTQVLENEAAATDARTAAGLALKNCISSRDKKTLGQCAQRWLSLPESTRDYTRDAVLRSLGSAAGQTAAQVLCSLAQIEIRKKSLELVSTLADGALDERFPEIRYNCIKAISFVCESLEGDQLRPMSDDILTALVHGARNDEPDIKVRRVAIRALINCLEFTGRNFRVESERDFIIQVLCEATLCPDPGIQAAAFECLYYAMHFYYRYMNRYMQPPLLEVVAKGMQHENEEVALQAIEFWSTVCEEEIEIKEKLDGNLQGGRRKSTIVCYDFAKRAFSSLYPVLLQLLPRKEDVEEDDDWSVPMSAATCLALFAQCVGDDVPGPVLFYVSTNWHDKDWRKRESALTAFGCIVEGPDEEKLAPVVKNALPEIFRLMRDKKDAVKESAAWALGQTSSILTQYLFDNALLRQVCKALVDGLSGSPRVLTTCCWSLLNLVDHLAPENCDRVQEPHPMARSFKYFIPALLKASKRKDNRSFCRASAYDALANIAHECGKSERDLLTNLLQELVRRLEKCAAAEQQQRGDAKERMDHGELVCSICGALATTVCALGHEIGTAGHKIVQCVGHLLLSNSRDCSMDEDLFLLLGAVASALGTGLEPFAQDVVTLITQALRNLQDYQLCKVAVAVAGDVCRALGEPTAQYCSGFMDALVTNLSSRDLHRSLQPALLACFGDIASSINGHFERYFPVTMNFLEAATFRRLTEFDPDSVEYICDLHAAIIDAYIGIIQGMREGGKAHMLRPHVPRMVEFLRDIYTSRPPGDLLMRSTLGMLGDLAETFPNGEVAPLLSVAWVVGCVIDGKRNKRFSAATRQTAEWAAQVLHFAASGGTEVRRGKHRKTNNPSDGRMFHQTIQPPRPEI